MSSTAVSEKRKPLSINTILVIAAMAAGAFVVATPSPQQPPGGFANAARPADPGVDPDELPSLRHVATGLSNGIGEVASAVISQAHR